MSRERFDPAIVQELEEELRQALTLEPSPDFARQVRARIERRSSQWTATSLLSWPVALAAAAACVLAVGIAWRMARETPPVHGVPIAAHVGADVTLKPERTPLPPMRGTAKVAPSRAVHVVKPGEPEVIVPPDPARALASLVELVRTDAVDEESLRRQARVVSAATLTIAPLVVPEISVTKLDVQNSAARGGSDRQ